MGAVSAEPDLRLIRHSIRQNLEFIADWKVLEMALTKKTINIIC